MATALRAMVITALAGLAALFFARRRRPLPDPGGTWRPLAP